MCVRAFVCVRACICEGERGGGEERETELRST